MGQCCSNSSPEGAESKKIDNKLKKDRVVSEHEVKILLLGAGESGKSTIFKQMKIIHQQGYTEDERKAFKAIVHSNTINCIKILVATAKDQFDIQFDEAIKASALEILEWPLDTIFSSTQAAMIARLYASDAIKQTCARETEFQLPDSYHYFLSSVERLGASNYMPNVDDILHSRVRTTGIVQNTWTLDGVRFRMFDVGGQRSERRKWIHCFDAVTAVLFVASLTGYNRVLYEDDSKFRMEEELGVFDQICNSRWFQETSMILFLNKRDLFQQTYHSEQFKSFFREFDSQGQTGEEEIKLAIKHVQSRFESRNHTPAKAIYTHVTCATDTTMIATVFGIVKDIVITSHVRESGF